MPNHAGYFISSRYILPQLEVKAIKTILEKMLIGRKSRALGTIASFSNQQGTNNTGWRLMRLLEVHQGIHISRMVDLPKVGFHQRSLERTSNPSQTIQCICFFKNNKNLFTVRLIPEFLHVAFLFSHYPNCKLQILPSSLLSYNKT